MLVSFFFLLREAGLKVSITEFLTLLELLKKRVISFDVEQFYYLSRACLVKDESLYDRFDRAFQLTSKVLRIFSARRMQRFLMSGCASRSNLA